MNINNKYKLNYLSSKFYEKYNRTEYPEIENKESRPYMVMLISIESNTFAVPFRTNIKHSSCYKFTSSTRPTDTVTRFDYTKAVIINDSAYIGNPARINDKKYTELDANHHIIIKQFSEYVKEYIKFASGKKAVYNAQKYKYTALQYFHKELNIK